MTTCNSTYNLLTFLQKGQYEPVHEKINNLHMQKQRRRSAVQ